MSSMSQFLPLPAVRRLLKQHKVDARYAKRARSWVIFSTLIEPLRWIENIRFGRQIRNTELNGDPVFLLGFGRSGTTHLHNLFYQDPQFGVVSNYQASMHPVALMGRNWLPRLLAGQMPKTRWTLCWWSGPVTLMARLRESSLSTRMAPCRAMFTSPKGSTR